MYRAISIAAVASAAAAAAAQPFHSPPSFTGDGSGSVVATQPFNTSLRGRRFQYVVNDVHALPAAGGVNITAIAVQRDPSAPGYPARTADVSIVLDNVDYAAVTSTFAANYSGGQTTVLDATAVNLPETSAGGFEISFPISPFTYFGDNNPTNPANTALLVEFATRNVVGGSFYSLDCESGSTTTTVGTFTYNGAWGCRVPPNPTTMEIFASGPTTGAGQQTRCSQYSLYGPPNTFGILSIGITDPNTRFGGALCAPLRALPDVYAGLFVFADASGAVGSPTAPIDLVFPDLADLPFTFYTQFVMVDVNRTIPEYPVSLSDGVRWDVTPPQRLERRMVFASADATAATGTPTYDYIPVFRFQ